jgi:hypothetical protein
VSFETGCDTYPKGTLCAETGAAVIRPEPGEWHPRMPEGLEERRSSRTGAKCAPGATPSLTVGTRVAVADA